MSGILKLTNTVLAGTTITNLLADTKFDYLPRAAVVTIYAVQDLIAAPPSSIELDFTLGTTVIGDDLIPNANPVGGAGVGTGPKTNEDILAKGVGEAGDRIQLRARETTGGVAADGILRTQIVIEDL